MPTPAFGLDGHPRGRRLDDEQRACRRPSADYENSRPRRRAPAAPNVEPVPRSGVRTAVVFTRVGSNSEVFGHCRRPGHAVAVELLQIGGRPVRAAHGVRPTQCRWCKDWQRQTHVAVEGERPRRSVLVTADARHAVDLGDVDGGDAQLRGLGDHVGGGSGGFVGVVGGGVKDSLARSSMVSRAIFCSLLVILSSPAIRL